MLSRQKFSLGGVGIRMGDHRGNDIFVDAICIVMHLNRFVFSIGILIFSGILTIRYCISRSCDRVYNGEKKRRNRRLRTRSVLQVTNELPRIGKVALQASVLMLCVLN